MDFYLKAESAEAMMLALESSGVISVQDKQPVISSKYALDLIGSISKQVGEIDNEPIMQEISGYHANLRGDLSEEQLSSLSGVILPEAPKQPVRVWA